MRVDIEQEERRRAQKVDELFREETFQMAKEPIRITKPRAAGAKTSGPEDVFRRRLAQPAPERIENLYQRRRSAAKPGKTAANRWLDRWAEFLPIPDKLSFGRKGIAVVTLVFLIVISVFFASIVAVKADIRSMEGEARSLMEDLQQSRISSARDRLAALENKRARYVWVYGKIRPAFLALQGKNKANHVDQLLEISGSGLHLIKTGLDSYVVLERGYRQFLGQEEGESTETFAQVSGQLEILYTELSSLQAKLQRLNNPYYLTQVDSLKIQLSERVPRWRKYFLSAQQLSYVLPEILGENGQKKQYLILLQNNAELRATGGFIGSYALLTVENGKFLDFRVEDVYEADGQLNGFVAPPPEITQYLGEAQWFLRDVNWSPDFPTVARQAAWFLDKETKTKPDGVIGVNLAVVKQLLAVTGPIRLVDYDEVITKDNLYERAQQHAELNFFPGSTQKRDFLSAVASALFEKMFREDASTLMVMKSMLQSADESELLVYLDNEKASEALHNLGWDGALRTPDCPNPFPAQSCFVDTVMQVESNVGVNKANQFIKRQIKQKVTISRNQALHERTVVLQNTADSNAWPEGAYKNYFRLFVTKSAQLSAITINGTPVDLRGVKTTVEKDKTAFGFLVNVPIQSTVEIQIAYTVPIPEATPLVYALFEQKQPGAGNDPLSTSITIEDRPVLTVAPEPKINGRTLDFTADHQTHQFYAVEMR
jgi:hypothetical protein